MRRSTIYLGISLALLGVGLFNACRKGRRNSSTCTCRTTDKPVNTQPGSVTGTQAPVAPQPGRETPRQLLDEAYEHGLGGDYDSASRKARMAAVKLELAQEPWSQRAEAELMLAYAERGYEMFSSSIGTHNRIIQRGKTHGDIEPDVLIDAHVGRAAAQAELFQFQFARDDLATALELALQQAEGDDPDGRAAYQLACVYAVRSQLWEKEGDPSAAERDRQLALNRLRIARRNGYENFRHMVADLDLASLRGTPEFKALLK